MSSTETRFELRLTRPQIHAIADALNAQASENERAAGRLASRPGTMDAITILHDAATANRALTKMLIHSMVRGAPCAPLDRHNLFAV